MKILIDGDGSPVKDIVIDIAQSYGIEVIIVTSLDHFSRKKYPPQVSIVYVDQGNDAADFRIVQLVRSSDILITQDYGLASLVLPKKVRVVHHLGYEYTANTIGGLLEQRYISAKIRKNGGRTKGPKPYTKNDADIFRTKLLELLTENER